jgi:hypothetical protein
MILQLIVESLRLLLDANGQGVWLDELMADGIELSVHFVVGLIINEPSSLRMRQRGELLLQLT